MAVGYSIIQRIKPGDPTAPRKYYAVAQSSGEASLRNLADQIAEISTVSSIDTLAVLESLLQVIPDHLLQSRIVRLGDFGSFRLTLSSDGADTEADFNKSLIKKVRLNFRPGKLIGNSLKTAEYVKV
jgi:predicted histone-like DNA-binding protein